MPGLEKEIMVSELRRCLEGSSTLLVTGYSRLGSNEINELRQDLYGVGAHYMVVKNRLARIAMEENRARLVERIDGPTAFVLTSGDPVVVARVLVKFMKNHTELELRGGVVQSILVGKDQIRELANLPGREQLVAMLIGSLTAPVVRLVNVINNPIGSFVRTLNAITKKVDS